jgi:hypothetical protein
MVGGQLPGTRADHRHRGSLPSHVGITFGPWRSELNHVIHNPSIVLKERLPTRIEIPGSCAEFLRDG